MTDPLRKTSGKKRPQKTEHISEPDFLISEHDRYPQIEPGEYELLCTEARTYRDPGLRTWKCRYRFHHALDMDFPAVFGFPNLGAELKSPGRRSRYFHEWTIANGGMPGKRQKMSAKAFVGKIFRVHVDWVQPKRHDGLEHTPETRYSLVKAIRARVGP